MNLEPSLQWGILATGGIAHKFACGLRHSATGRLVAVGSRSAESAGRFGAEFGLSAEASHPSYEAMLADPKVQAVYISNPHPGHAEWAIKAAEAGKHVLCEKPLAMNAAEAGAMVEAARRGGVFLMEAFMYRCHPQTRRLAELVRAGAVGRVNLIQASFGFRAPPDPRSRLFDPALGGGGILDVGCYPVSAARLLAGAANGQAFAEPVAFHGAGRRGATGVDVSAAATLEFSGGVLAQVACGLEAPLENAVRVFGDEGWIHVPTPFIPSLDGGPSRVFLHRAGREQPEEIVFDFPADRPIFTRWKQTISRRTSRRARPRRCRGRIRWGTWRRWIGGRRRWGEGSKEDSRLKIQASRKDGRQKSKGGAGRPGGRDGDFRRRSAPGMPLRVRVEKLICQPPHEPAGLDCLGPPARPASGRGAFPRATGRRPGGGARAIRAAFWQRARPRQSARAVRRVRGQPGEPAGARPGDVPARRAARGRTLPPRARRAGPDRHRPVVFNAGGPGVGKSTGVTMNRMRAQIIMDGTLSNYAKSRANIQTAFDHGKNGLINYVQRAYEETLQSIVGRAADPANGRIVSVLMAAKGRIQARENVLRLAREHADRPDFMVRAVDNTHNTGRRMASDEVGRQAPENLDDLLARGHVCVNRYFDEHASDNPALTAVLRRRLLA